MTGISKFPEILGKLSISKRCVPGSFFLPTHEPGNEARAELDGGALIIIDSKLFIQGIEFIATSDLGSFTLPANALERSHQTIKAERCLHT